jgi:hypothetical protein
MGLLSNDYDYWITKLQTSYKAYLNGGLNYEEYILTIANIHDLLVDAYYLGADELEGLIYELEEKIENGIH